MRTVASLMDFSQSSLLQSILPLRGRILGFLTIHIFRVEFSNPTPNPQRGGQILHIYIPGDRMAQLSLQAPSNNFIRLLRHAWGIF